MNAFFMWAHLRTLFQTTFYDLLQLKQLRTGFFVALGRALLITNLNSLRTFDSVLGVDTFVMTLRGCVVEIRMDWPQIVTHYLCS